MTGATDAALYSALYSAAEFRQAVLSLEPKIAVFDCDGTLWEPDSGYGFMNWTLDPAHRLVSAERQAWIDERYVLYGTGEVDEATICGDMVQLYAGLPEGTLGEAAAQYVREHVWPHVFPEMAELATTLREAGTEVWAVSSTNHWVVEAGVWGEGESVFRIPPERVLAARVNIEGGIATDRLVAVPTDEAKREALLAAGVRQPDVVFGNSIHDAAMLEMARLAFPVNANSALTNFAQARGWRIFRP